MGVYTDIIIVTIVIYDVMFVASIVALICWNRIFGDKSKTTTLGHTLCATIVAYSGGVLFVVVV